MITTWAKNRLKELLDSKNVGVAKHSSEGGALEISNSRISNVTLRDCDSKQASLYIRSEFELEFKVTLPAHMKGGSNKPIRGRLIYPRSRAIPIVLSVVVKGQIPMLIDSSEVLSKDMDSRVQEKLASFDREHRTRK